MEQKKLGAQMKIERARIRRSRESESASASENRSANEEWREERGGDDKEKLAGVSTRLLSRCHVWLLI